MQTELTPIARLHAHIRALYDMDFVHGFDASPIIDDLTTQALKHTIEDSRDALLLAEIGFSGLQNVFAVSVGRPWWRLLHNTARFFFFEKRTKKLLLIILAQ